MTRLDALLRTDKDMRPIRAALPIREDPAGAKEAVLLLHGFTGNPSELAVCAAALSAEGYAVSVPRYPGHGTRRSDLMTTRAEDWARRAFDAYMDLAAVYAAVHVVGHSMGGLLATAVAAAFGAPKLVLLAPAFKVTGQNLTLAQLMAPIRPVIRRDRPLAAADKGDPIREALHREYWADDLVAPASQLGRLMRSCAPRLGSLVSRTFVIVGEKDGVVPVEVVDLIRAKASNVASFESIVLAGAGHLFPFDERAKETAALVADWITRP
jgi:carboxylesterase